MFGLTVQVLVWLTVAADVEIGEIVCCVTIAIMLAASSGKRNVTMWRPYVCPSVCPDGILMMTQPGSSSDDWPDNK